MPSSQQLRPKCQNQVGVILAQFLGSRRALDVYEPAGNTRARRDQARTCQEPAKNPPSTHREPAENPPRTSREPAVRTSGKNFFTIRPLRRAWDLR